MNTTRYDRSLLLWWYDSVQHIITSPSLGAVRADRWLGRQNFREKLRNPKEKAKKTHQPHKCQFGTRKMDKEEEKSASTRPSPARNTSVNQQDDEQIDEPAHESQGII